MLTLLDTLQALKMFVAEYEGNGHDSRELRPEMIAARAAITKAESCIDSVNAQTTT